MTAKTTLPPISEKQFMAQVIALAKLHHWSTYHTFDSRRSGAGFPDLVCTRKGRILFIELKTEKGKLRPDQCHWLGALRDCPGVEVYLWRPSQWAEIEKVLA